MALESAVDVDVRVVNEDPGLQPVSRGHLFYANGREYFEIGGLVLSAPEDASLDEFGYRWPSQIVSFVSDLEASLAESAVS